MCGVFSCVSTLHLVDLVGCQPLSGHKRGAVSSAGSNGKAGPKTALALHCCQSDHGLASGAQVVNQQLLALSRVISELAAAKQTGGAGKVLSSRASKLTQILSPLLGGEHGAAS